jgi:glycosyltransferase involved in cell wall biosynthesis
MRSQSVPHLIVILSRCAWTLHNFRLRLIHGAEVTGSRTIAAGSDEGQWGERLKKSGVDFRSIPVSKRGVSPLIDLILFFSLVRFFWTERPAVVHSFTIKLVIYGTIAAWVSRIPVRVVTITGLGHAFLSDDNFLRRVVEYLYRFALARAHAVVFQNKDDLALFLQRGLVQASKTRLVAGSGVNLSRFNSETLPLLSLGRPTILMVARLLKEKGVVEYVEAARAVRTQNPEVQFLFLGGVDARNPSSITEAQFKALNWDKAVQWLGEVEDVVPVIRCADIVVLPSYREGTPRSLLEAAAMGRPLIAADVPGCREVVNHGANGLLIPARDAGALASAVLAMVRDVDELTKMGGASRALVEEKFDETKVIAETVSLYLDIFNGSNRT